MRFIAHIDIDSLQLIKSNVLWTQRVPVNTNKPTFCNNYYTNQMAPYLPLVALQ